MDVNYYQILILTSQGILLATLMLLLFNLRKKVGYEFLYVCIGLFQFLQTFLSSTIYIKITENIIVSPGTTVIFTLSIFAVLIMYIKDDATETRKIIYALLISNIVVALLLFSFKLNLTNSELYNPLNFSTSFFQINARLLFLSTLTMLADAILIIVLYEFFSRFTNVLFIRMILTMIIVVGFDSIFYNLIAFADYKDVNKIFLSGILTKSIMSILYSIMFTIYIKYFEKSDSGQAINSFKDVFSSLSYKQKYDQINKEKKKIIKDAKKAILLSESKYKTLTKISPVGIFLTDKAGKTIFVNPKWCEITGLSYKEAMGYGWQKLLHKDDREQLLNNWNQATSNIKPNYEEFRFIKPDKSETWVLGQAVPDYSPSGEVIGFVGTITDITDIKKFEHELKKLKNKAEESDKLKSAFLANMSHEIRTPMNGILGFTELLKDPTISEKEREEYLELIEISGNRMMEIINNIVDISKIESGLTKVSFEKSDLHALCQEIFNFFENEANNKGLNLILNCPKELQNKYFLIDRNKTMSILTNLIKNAIKYTDNGKIEFGYNIIEEKEKFYFRFQVKDTGVGIPKHRQKAIFNRFVQADIADDNAKLGAGLGLAIAKAYVDMLDGIIILNSEEGKGTEFIFTMPCVEHVETIETLKKTTHLIKGLKPGIKVLIAEDDLNSFLIYSYYLKSTQWEIIHVKTGVEAVEAAKNNPDINLILMDIKMPLMDGHTATRRIREFMPDIIIIAQSAYAFDSKKEKDMNNFNQFMIKPIDKSTFLRVLGQYFPQENV